MYIVNIVCVFCWKNFIVFFCVFLDVSKFVVGKYIFLGLLCKFIFGRIFKVILGEEKVLGISSLCVIENNCVCDVMMM